MGTRRGEADEVRWAVRKGGAITRPTLDRLLVLLEEKTTHDCHIAVEVMTPTVMKDDRQRGRRAGDDPSSRRGTTEEKERVSVRALKAWTKER